MEHRFGTISGKTFVAGIESKVPGCINFLLAPSRAKQVQAVFVILLQPNHKLGDVVCKSTEAGKTFGIVEEDRYILTLLR